MRLGNSQEGKGRKALGLGQLGLFFYVGLGLVRFHFSLKRISSSQLFWRSICSHTFGYAAHVRHMYYVISFETGF